MDYSGRVTRFLCADFLGVSSIHFFFLKWAPAIDHTGKTYYYEISTRQSVWELQDLDPAEGDEVITDTSANTDRTRSVSSMNAYLTASSTGETGQLDRTGHNDDFADDLDSWSSSGNESYSLSPPAVTAGPNGSVKQNITIRHKKSKTTDHSAKSGNAVRSNRVSILPPCTFFHFSRISCSLCKSTVIANLLYWFRLPSVLSAQITGPNNVIHLAGT